MAADGFGFELTLDRTQPPMQRHRWLRPEGPAGGTLRLNLEPLMDDQESDTRGSTGAATSSSRAMGRSRHPLGKPARDAAAEPDELTQWAKLTSVSDTRRGTGPSIR